MSGLDLPLASRAKSSSAAALRDSASEERDGRVTRSEGGAKSTASCVARKAILKCSGRVEMSSTHMLC